MSCLEGTYNSRLPSPSLIRVPPGPRSSTARATAVTLQPSSLVVRFLHSYRCDRSRCHTTPQGLLTVALQDLFCPPRIPLRSATTLLYLITIVMFKSRHSPTSPGFIPDTPKLRKLSLPEEPCIGPSRPVTSADMRRPQTPAMVPASSSRANPTAGQPAKPLKSILKGGRNALPRDLYDSDGETIAAKKVACSRYNVPNVLPPGSHLGEYTSPDITSLITFLSSHAQTRLITYTLSDQLWQCP